MRDYRLSKVGIEPKRLQYQQVEEHKTLVIYDYSVQKGNMGEMGKELRIVQRSLQRKSRSFRLMYGIFPS